MVKTKTPILHAYIQIKLKDKCTGEVIQTRQLKEIIGRAIIRNNGGLPRHLVAYIIEDLIALNLLKRLNHKEYQLLQNPLEKRVRFIMNLNL